MHKESVFDGVEGNLPYKILDTSPEVQTVIISAFDSYFRNRELQTFQNDDPILRTVDDTIRVLSTPAPPTQHSIEEECDLHGLMFFVVLTAACCLLPAACCLLPAAGY